MFGLGEETSPFSFQSYLSKKENKKKIDMDNEFISFAPELGVINADTFSQIYPHVNKYLCENREWENSRDGMVKEMLDVKTHITNPYRRCVGGYGRNINVFFLLAEAMWIVTGRKDVKFLTLFNKQMAAYSDDGKVFHAPYGYRLRHWGITSEQEFMIETVENRGFDQVCNAIRILAANPTTRQVVMEIWNPSFDLGHVTKDIPCNDIVMLKIRDGRLITTIGNRSNDLHWGLPTNIFQFSFLTECMASALGVKLGTQTHNSQSLHVYQWNTVADTMNNNFIFTDARELYLSGATEIPIDFNYVSDLAINRFHELEYILNLIIDNITLVAEGKTESVKAVEQIKYSSTYLYWVYRLLRLYVTYKRSVEKASDEERRAVMTEKITEIRNIDSYIREEMQVDVNKKYWDVAALAMNFFYTRLKETNGVLGTL